MVDIAKSGETAQKIYINCINYLKAHGVENPQYDAGELLNLAFNIDRRLHKDYIPKYSQIQKLEQYIKRRANREPLQYILKTWSFYGFDLQIGSGVLIPRQDTESVCEIAIQLAKKEQKEQKEKRPFFIADLCAGSGAISIALDNNIENAHVTALELYEDAYAYLVKNKKSLAPSVNAVKADVFKYQSEMPPCYFDMIISNPPYISQSEMQHIMPELKFEPQTALLADDNGLLFYKHIAANYKSKLKKGGILIFEIGSGQTAAVSEILCENGYENINIKQDAQQKDRCVYAIAK